MQIHKWRPSYKCIYVISEIHGNINSLEILLDKILPLRKFAGQEDVLIMLGDYIDKGNSSKEVIDCLINIKKEFGERIILLRGNREDMLLKSIQDNDSYRNWLVKFGSLTISSYTGNNDFIPHNRLKDIFPKEHIEFIKNMPTHYEIDNYIFFHGSFNYKKSIKDNTNESFIYDYSASKFLKQNLNKPTLEFIDNKIFVGAHNYKDKQPFLHKKYFMLGGNDQKRLYMFDLNSMSAVSIKYNKSRIYKYNFNIHE